MLEYDMKRNGSGYYDETAVKTGLFTSGPQAGEIWETTEGKEYLILKNQGGFCNTLALRDNTTHSDNMEVISREKRWVNPGMVGYIINRGFAQYIKTLPEEKFLDIMQAVGDRLGVTIRVSQAEADTLKADNKDLGEMYHLACATIKEEQAENDKLRQALEQATQTRTAAEEKAALNEGMFWALMDRIFARGEAK